MTECPCHSCVQDKHCQQAVDRCAKIRKWYGACITVLRRQIYAAAGKAEP